MVRDQFKLRSSGTHVRVGKPLILDDDIADALADEISLGTVEIELSDEVGVE